MVRNYKRKTARGAYGTDVLQQALDAISGGMSVKKASVVYKIPRPTLRRHRDSRVKCRQIWCHLRRCQQVWCRLRCHLHQHRQIRCLLPQHYWCMPHVHSVNLILGWKKPEEFLMNCHQDQNCSLHDHTQEKQSQLSYLRHHHTRRCYMKSPAS